MSSSLFPQESETEVLGLIGGFPDIPVSTVSLHASVRVVVVVTYNMLALLLFLLVGGQLLVIGECPKVEEVPELSFGHGRGTRFGLMTSHWFLYFRLIYGI